MSGELEQYSVARLEAAWCTGLEARLEAVTVRGELGLWW